MDIQIAASSRIPTSFDSSSRDRQRQLASNQKVERVLGAHVSAPFLKLDTGSKGPTTQDKEVVLNSPISRCPTSFLPWSSRLPSDIIAASSVAPHNVAEPTPSPSVTFTSVAPLNFKKRPHRRSFSMAKIETEMTDYKRDAAQTFDVSELSLQADSHWQKTGDPSITRRQSLPESTTIALSIGRGSLKRHPRPLPPVPLSRPASPASSISSSFNSHNSWRPLPPPPKQAPISCSSSIIFAPAREASASASSGSESRSPPRGTRPSDGSVESRPESNLFSPLSPLSLITDLPSTLRVPLAPSPRSSEARKRHRIHASPYKLSCNPSRYSTTSLSSQVSVPPVPSPAELRRRNREKMAKLIRVLGESPPSDMVFSIEREQMRDSSEKTIIEESEESIPPRVTLEPLRRSVSVGLENSITGLFSKKKALSDPDAGHVEHAQSPTAPRFVKLTSVRRLRSKRGRAGIDKAPRYVVSLFDTAESKTPKRLAFKLNASAPKLRPTGSYLRGAYKSDVRPIEVKIPPLPAKIPGIDLPKHSHKWVRESGLNRWEVDDYENVVKSLRKL